MHATRFPDLAWATCLAGLTLLALPAQAQVAPGPQHQAEQREAAPPDETATAHPWSMPPIRVEGENKPELREEDRIGSYGQPRWSANRRFPTTRIYVVPAATFTLEYWNQYNTPFSGSAGRRVRSYYEAEMGLGHRLQLDLYLITEQDGYKGPSVVKKESVELRYALADWGKLWGNPTLYLEWTRQNGSPDALEGKLLLGGQLAPGWHAGANLVLERQIGGGNGHEYQAEVGISHTLTDERLSLGLEARAEIQDSQGARFKNLHDNAFLLGPSVSWSPLSQMRVLWAVLGGATKGELNPQADGSSPYGGAVESWLVTSWTF